MDKPLIVVGDTTDHGGVVLTGSATTLINGKRVACIGDEVSCPHSGHGGTTVIVAGSSSTEIDGKRAARHGDKTACGASLISAQATTTTV
jgi:uncharacterized Zn-binding protein involved in type VI secretion